MTLLDRSAVRTTEEIEQSNLRRLAAINAMGIPLMGIDTHHVIEILRVFMVSLSLDPVPLLANADHRQQLWLEGELERIEGDIRRGILTAPLQQPQSGA